MNKLIKILNDHSDRIWGKNFEAITKKEQPKKVHMSELWKYLESENYDQE